MRHDSCGVQPVFAHANYFSIENLFQFITVRYIHFCFSDELEWMLLLSDRFMSDIKEGSAFKVECAPMDTLYTDLNYYLL